MTEEELRNSPYSSLDSLLDAAVVLGLFEEVGQSTRVASSKYKTGRCRRTPQHVNCDDVSIVPSRLSIRPESISILLHRLRRKRKLRRALLMLLCPLILDLISSLPRKKRFWSLHPTLQSQQGFWEKEVMVHWRGIYRRLPSCRDWLDNKFIEAYRVDVLTFKWLVRRCKDAFQRKDTQLRLAIDPCKRFAIVLHWLAHGHTERQLGNIYHVVATTVHSAIYTWEFQQSRRLP